MARDQDLRKRILEAAKASFLQRGFSGSNIRAIAKSAGVSMGGLYHHFSNKEELYETLLSESTIPEEALTFSAMLAEDSFPENTGEIGRMLWKTVDENKDFFKLIYVDILEFQGKHVRPFMTEFQTTLTRLSEAALSERLKGEDSPRAALLVRVLLAVFFHARLEAMMLGYDLADVLGLSEEELCSDFTEVLLRGFRSLTHSKEVEDEEG